MTEYVAEARLENAYEYANSKLTLNPTTGGRSDERFEWSGMEENENLYVCVCVCVCVCGQAPVFYGHMKNSCLLTFIFWFMEFLYLDSQCCLVTGILLYLHLGLLKRIPYSVTLEEIKKL